MRSTSYEYSTASKGQLSQFVANNGENPQFRGDRTRFQDGG